MFKITATELPRFMACNGSRLLDRVERQAGDETAKDEGNAADWVVEQVFTGQFELEELVDRKAPNGVYITSEMAEYLEEYLLWLNREGEIERDTSYSGQDWFVAGRADHIKYDKAADHLIVSDLKYGWKIVEPNDNWTLISHAVGYCNATGYTPKNIQFRIYQPRPYHPKGNVRMWRISWQEFEELRQRIYNNLSAPADQLKTSEHCYKCPSASVCPAAQIANMNAIDVAYRAYTADVSNDDLEFLIEENKKALEVIKQNLSAYEDLAIYKLKNGQTLKNHQIQNDLGRESWLKHVTPELMEMLTGKEVIKKQLLTPNQVKKMGVPVEVVSSLTERKNKGVKLVRVSANERASKLFNN